MNISDKIEKIRRQPEHVRLRYVWAGVAIVMFFIIIIWIFSLQEAFKNSIPEPKESALLKNQWESAKENMPSIEEFMQNNPQSNINNEIAPPASPSLGGQENSNETGTNQ